jgi:hypothetical protein
MTDAPVSAVRAFLAAVLLLSLAACGATKANSSDAATAGATDVDAGTCPWPAGVKSIDDASGVGCWAQPAFNICQVPSGGSVGQDGMIRGADGQVVTNACRNACSASEYALTCAGDSMGPSQIPSPDPAFGCTAIVVPTPGNALFYCCPCQ